MKEISRVFFAIEDWDFLDQIHMKLTWYFQSGNIGRHNKPSQYVFNKDFKITRYAWIKKGSYYYGFHPCEILMYSSPPYIRWSHNINLNREITRWINENNIVLSKENNFEIPDEYKVEFKLRFM